MRLALPKKHSPSSPADIPAGDILLFCNHLKAKQTNDNNNSVKYQGCNSISHLHYLTKIFHNIYLLN